MGDKFKKRYKDLLSMTAKCRQQSIPLGNKKRFKLSSTVSGSANCNRKRRCCSDSPGRRLQSDLGLLVFNNISDGTRLGTDFLRARVKDTYGPIEMPDDFYQMWTFCSSIKPENPKGALLSFAGIELCGPYDCIANHIENTQLHCRYYFDPPEFMTVMRSEDFHVGYVRDTPLSMPWCVAMNNETRSFEFKKVGNNMFAALRGLLLVLQLEASRRHRDQINQLICKIVHFTKQKGINCLSPTTKTIQHHEAAAYAVPLSGLGMQQISEEASFLNNRDLSEILQKAIIDKDYGKVQQYEILLKRCDDNPALALYVSLCMFSFGLPCLHRIIEKMGCWAYDVLGIPDYGETLALHLHDRRKANAVVRRIMRSNRLVKKHCIPPSL
ncbi:hypothetical protein GJ496_010282 [Pomphorhynchus laevis]|nr:hypothetical protein GJ496_010282 [Pomphorhynchus laevis]